MSAGHVKPPATSVNEQWTYLNDRSVGLSESQTENGRSGNLERREIANYSKNRTRRVLRTFFLTCKQRYCVASIFLLFLLE